ncbi:MAP kinase-activated protein kinase 5 isoform X4 [Cebus imitator]|uniref:non-specific serine/threonine protein kinase n=1 Tax=Sapajus apella TaxID=9515 RepID=A0A6J3EM90_SAPAP|nr:MAP kinase-activated protein kinase 5 isoform X3 [Sapajus apella]XP_035113554.1 MAP kinase-activated protein kinase 5 isoform X3 [Callithrix jacchus]XP_037599537.1 MAP kinase-activated protein kinase 5 isoform X4 [Cebus imitator]XP_039328268.1 MAP kinase-activated protein kinase 5 isoform X3 [Saimiri boliviensis boliviensis]
MSEESDMEKAIKETSILEEYNINWTQKLGAGISGPVRVCVKKSTQERFALKILLDRPKARNEGPTLNCNGDDGRGRAISQNQPAPALYREASQPSNKAALALRHCHLLNIAHRDLKPENLLFKDNSLDAPVKLCDFGFAKIDQGDLMTPQFTPYYVAPQVLEAQRRHQKEKSGIIPTSPTPYTYNKSCDLWSLGVIIYVMLCGYPPFYSKHHSRTIPKDMRRKIMTGSFEFPEEEWSQISEMAKDVVRKLLKVKPEERLTIEGVLDHPWLNSTEALDNVLPSAQLMMDKAVVAGIQQAHAEQLANMRIQDLKVSLKPLHSVNNPILRKRKLLGTKPKDSVYIHDHENGAEDSNVALEKLRDVIAQCILPQAGKGENEDEKLNEVMQEAWKYNRECKLLRDTLQSFSWNGRGFTDKVDRLKLAEIVKQVIEEQTTSHESQ